MKLTAEHTYRLSTKQCTDLIASVGHQRTVILEGAMGIGKSSIGAEFAKHPKTKDHVYINFDCTNKDIQDLSAPQFEQKVADEICAKVRFVPNAEMGVHLGVKVIIDFDEFKKAPPPVQRAIRGFMLIRTICGITLPEGSIIYGSSNLGAEGLGDVLLPHQRNAVITVRMRKPTNMEWITDFGINKGCHHTVLGWVKDTPALGQEHDEVSNWEDNQLNFHPQNPNQKAFCTWRSVHAASDLVHSCLTRAEIDRHTLTASLIGTIGVEGAMQLSTHIDMDGQMPSQQSIIDDPLNALVPSSVSAMCMVVSRALTSMNYSLVSPFMKYIQRPEMNPAAVSYFIQGARNRNYSHTNIVVTNADFTRYLRENESLFDADVK